MQEERHDGGGPDVRCIHVAEPELHFVFYTCLTRLRLRLSHQGGVDLNADTTRAELLCGGDRDAAVAGAEVIDDVLRADLSQFQQCAHDRHWRGLVANVLSGYRAAAGRHEPSEDESDDARQSSSIGGQRLTITESAPGGAGP